MEVSGFEIHMGQTQVNEPTAAFRITATSDGSADEADGAINAGGKVIGTYIHGILNNDNFRHALLNNIRRYWGLAENRSGITSDKEREYDKLADVVRQNMDITSVYEIMDKGI